MCQFDHIISFPLHLALSSTYGYNFKSRLFLKKIYSIMIIIFSLRLCFGHFGILLFFLFVCF